MLNMVEHKKYKLNSLQILLPEGLLAPTSWLEARGYSRSLLSAYVARGWLESPARGVYRRPGPSLMWQHVVATLQQQIVHEREPLLHVGGLTALQHRGFGHYVPLGRGQTVWLYGPAALPAWVKAASVEEKFVVRSDATFASIRVWRDQQGRFADALGAPLGTDALAERGLIRHPWGREEWSLVYSSEERAILEMLQDVHARESLDHCDQIMQGLGGLRPKRVSALLAVCKSVKTKRFFLALAERHDHAWLKRLDWNTFDWGAGKRSVFAGGRMHPKYQISLPEFDDRV